MGQRDDLYNLKDIIEFDEAYISVATEPKTTVKRGKGSQKKRAMWGACQSLCLQKNLRVVSKVKVELAKTVDVADASLEKATALIEKNAPKKKTRTKKK